MANSAKLPPGPKSKFPLNNLINFRQDSISFLRNMAQEYGDITHFRMGPLRVVLLNHPDYIKEVLSTQHSNFIKGRPLEMVKELLGDGLLTSEGDFHKRNSRIIQPAFHRNMMNYYADPITDYASRLVSNWEDGKKVDMMEEMVRMSTGIAAKTMFNVDVHKDALEINRALDDVMELFGRITLPFAEYLLKLPLPGTIRFFKAKAKLDETIYGIIDERRRNPVNNGDLLSLLLQSQAEEGGMSDQQVRDEALTLFLTAFDTTSLALTWTWYLLSQNPEVEAKLHEELDQVLGGRTPTMEDYPRLKYTRMVFGESMRLYPPIYIISRQAIEDFSVGDYIVPAGSIVLLSPYLIHHDARFHPEPEQFNPAAWNERSGGQQSRYEYFPFSVGPRSCIGQHYAWLEGVLVLSSIAQSWRAQVAPNHKVEAEQLLNLRPKNGMMMHIKRRM